MNKNYKLGDSVSLMTVKFTSLDGEKEKYTYTVPDEKGMDINPYENVFPYDEHPNVRAEIYLYDILIIDTFEQQAGGVLFVGANKKINTVKYRYDGEGQYEPVVDIRAVTNQFTVNRPFDVAEDNIQGLIWLKDDGTFAIDVDYIQFILNENQKWNLTSNYRLDAEFFSLLNGFIRKVKRNLVVDNTLVPNDLSKLREVAFSRVRNKVVGAHGRKTCALIAQFVLPGTVNHNVFLNSVQDEIMAAFPFRRDLTCEDIGFYYEKIAVPHAPSGRPDRIETRAEVKIIIFTGLYNRLQSSIVGKRSTGTLADKLVGAWASAMMHLGVEDADVKLNLYLNEKRVLLVNHITGSIYDIYNAAILPINDKHNWRNTIEQFVKYATFAHGNKAVNLCGLKLRFPSGASSIPDEAILRLRAEVKCEKGSEVLWIDDGESTYLFFTEKCVKARLKTPEEMEQVNYTLTQYLKNAFEDKIHINYTVKDYFTLFNLYSDVDIGEVYQTILSRYSTALYTKPTLVMR